MHRASKVQPPREEKAPEAKEQVVERPRFERPRVLRLGALPAVTTAFGGSFNP